VNASTLVTLTLGAPGLYQVADNPIRALTGVRMDVCAFVGVAPRGPSRDPYFARPWAPQPPADDGSTVRLATPVPVESWNAYTRLFGAFEGPGLLPYAVASFFDNGGRRAYIVRIVHRYRKPDGTADEAQNAAGCAQAPFEGLTATGGRAVWVRARSEGAWGNGLRARLSLSARTLGLPASAFFVDRLRVPVGFGLAPGTTLRLWLGGGAKAIRRVTTVLDDWNPLDGSRQTWAWLDAPTVSPAVAGDVVEATVTILDGVNPVETHEGVGVCASHPRWLASVLVNDSDLLYPCDNPSLPGDPLASWIDADLGVDPTLPSFGTRLFEKGADRYGDIVPEDFFDPEWVLGDEDPGCGVHALVDVADLSLVVAPDLYSPGRLPPVEIVTGPANFAGSAFAECVAPAPGPAQAAPPADLTGLRLDPLQQLDTIAALQRRLTDLADDLQSFIVLLDVPPGLSQKQALSWRATFDTAYAAAYHPWLDVARSDDRRRALLRVNPAALAAGIIAQRETESGVPYGPANVIAVNVVAVADRVSPARHDELHQHAINVYLPERDGVRLTSARTLSLDPAWRQLNVRRLITMIRRALALQMQWATFEPNGPRLRVQVARMLESFLRRLYHANAFTGATEADAFFVTCDDTFNTPLVQRAGELIALVGVAPAEPLEFIVLQLARSGDSILTLEAN